MPHNPDVDQYIENAAAFAQPILKHIRALFHSVCPNVEETIKWGAPHFEYKGILAQTAAFKAHIRFAFWKGDVMEDPSGWLRKMGKTRIGVVRIESMDDLPPDGDLSGLIMEAMDLNERGIPSKVMSRQGRKKAQEVDVPDWFMAAISANPDSLEQFESFSNSHRKEYVEWVTEAKQEATRKRRVDQAVEWMAEGKPKEWKYMKEWRK